ncbi:hypothetical protein [uncultured Dialister sp.]|jgi:hypothetical protein|nr:hypothetical protein [uncultured Dialister sp.]
MVKESNNGENMRKIEKTDKKWKEGLSISSRKIEVNIRMAALFYGKGRQE